MVFGADWKCLWRPLTYHDKSINIFQWPLTPTYHDNSINIFQWPLTPTYHDNSINITPARSWSGAGGGATASLVFSIGIIFSRHNSFNVPQRFLQLIGSFKSGFVINTWKKEKKSGNTIEF